MLVANLPKLTVLRLSVEGVNIGDVCQVAFGLHMDQETLLDIISRPLARPVDTFLSAQLLSDVYLEGIGTSHVAVPLKQLTRFAGDIFVSKTISRSSKMLLELVEVGLWMRCPIELSYLSNGPLWHAQLSPPVRGSTLSVFKYYSISGSKRGKTSSNLSHSF